MKYLKFAALAVFVTYWAATIFFTLPDNYLKIKLASGERLFTSLFYQQWSFFAPPPTTTNRLYYAFATADTTTEILSTEVLAQLQQERRRYFIFNDRASLEDDILSGSIGTFTDRMIEDYDLYRHKNCGAEVDNQTCHEQFLKDKRQAIHQWEPVQALHHYGQLIARQRGPEFREKFPFLKITIAEQSIPKFADRHLPNTDPQIGVIWYTDWVAY